MPLNGCRKPFAEAHAFLTSAQNNHITGQVLYVDGGAEPVTRPDREL